MLTTKQRNDKLHTILTRALQLVDAIKAMKKEASQQKKSKNT